MAQHKFTYTVSGVHLSDEQQQRVSRAIATAVAGAIAGEAPGEVHTDALSLLRIYGGIWQKVLVPGVEGEDRVLAEVGAIAARE